MAVPITYQADRKRVEVILLEAATLHAVDPASLAAEARDDLERRFGMASIDLDAAGILPPYRQLARVDGALIVGTHRIRSAKDAMSCYIITELDKAGIGIPTATYDIVGFPPIKVRADGDAGAAQPAA